MKNSSPIKIFINNLVCFCLGLSLLVLTGCSSSDAVSVGIASVTVLPDDEPLISKGQEVQLEAIAENSAGAEVFITSVIWTSSNSSVLTVNDEGLMTGVSSGTATVSAEVEGVTGSINFQIVDLTGTWVGGEDGDNVTYTLTQTGTSVDGVFESGLGFPPITDVNTGVLTGSLNFGTYSHVLEVITEENCTLQIIGDHFLELESGALVLIGGSGSLSSSNCTIFGSISFATLERQ